jgi:hypothetical protein
MLAVCQSCALRSLLAAAQQQLLLGPVCSRLLLSFYLLLTCLQLCLQVPQQLDWLSTNCILVEAPLELLGKQSATCTTSGWLGSDCRQQLLLRRLLLQQHLLRDSVASRSSRYD